MDLNWNEEKEEEREKLGRISVWMRKWNRNEYKYRTKYRNHVVLYGTEQKYIFKYEYLINSIFTLFLYTV